jgi:hypothetical protein
VLGALPVKNHTDIVQTPALASNQCTGIGFLQCCVLVHGQPDAGSPLGQRVERIEVKQVLVASRCRDAQDVVQLLSVI